MEGVHCPSLVGSLGSLCLYKTFFPAFAAFVGQVQHFFSSPPYTILLHLSSSPSKLGRQSCYVTCLCYLQYDVTAQLLYTYRNPP